MRKIIAITQVTLDGVMQAPGGPEEDPRNGFTHGGWAMPLNDGLNQAIGETIAAEFDMLLGRRMYEIFAAYWPNSFCRQPDLQTTTEKIESGSGSESPRVTCPKTF